MDSFKASSSGSLAICSNEFGVNCEQLRGTPAQMLAPPSATLWRRSIASWAHRYQWAR
jgi:hypothetical protein